MTKTAFTLSDKYLDAFGKDACIPGDNISFSKTKYHINKYGGQNYSNQKINADGKIISDSIIIGTQSGAQIQITRYFKKPLKLKDYRELIKVKNSAEIRKNIKIYKGTILKFDELCEETQSAISDIFNKIFPKNNKKINYSPKEFLSYKTKLINDLILKICNIEDSEIDHDTPSLISKIIGDGFRFIPWIKRRDRIFTPEKFKKDRQIFVTSEARTFLFLNSLALRVRRVFISPLHSSEYESYKSSHKKTLVDMAKKRKLDLFSENATDLTACVKEYNFFPLFLIAPQKQKGNKVYLTSPQMKETDPNIVGIIDQMLSKKFDRFSIADTTVFQTQQSLDLSMAMMAIHEMSPHSFAISQEDFHKNVDAARAQLKGQESPSFVF